MRKLDGGWKQSCLKERDTEREKKSLHLYSTDVPEWEYISFERFPGLRFLVSVTYNLHSDSCLRGWWSTINTVLEESLEVVGVERSWKENVTPESRQQSTFCTESGFFFVFFFSSFQSLFCTGTCVYLITLYMLLEYYRHFWNHSIIVIFSSSLKWVSLFSHSLFKKKR